MRNTVEVNDSEYEDKTIINVIMDRNDKRKELLIQELELNETIDFFVRYDENSVGIEIVHEVEKGPMTQDAINILRSL